MIPVLNLKDEISPRRVELLKAIEEVIDSTQFINGDYVTKFENEFANYLGCKYAIGVNSGTDALVIALRAMGIGAGDEVIVPAFSFFATSECVGLLGARAVFVDICPKTFNIDTSKIESVITNKTKAIIPVHLFGQSANMSEIIKISKKHGIKILEDVAQAFGATYEQKKCGTMGEVSAFSFFPSKNLGTFGDGGMITTDCESLAQMCRVLKNHGGQHKYHNEYFGYNSRLDGIQAAILSVKLKYLTQDNEQRREAAARYTELLQGFYEVVVPFNNPNCKHVYHQYTLRVLNNKRDLLQKHLKDNGVETMVYYPVPLHKLPVYKSEAPQTFLNSEAASGEVLSLPMGSVLSGTLQQKIVDCIKRFYG